MSKPEYDVDAEVGVAPTEMVGFAEVVEEPKKKDHFKISASFFARDEDNAKVKLTYSGEGETVAEALADLKDDQGNPYPQSLTVLINLKVIKNGQLYERALAPHKARLILQNKEVAVFNNLFRGI